LDSGGVTSVRPRQARRTDSIPSVLAPSTITGPSVTAAASAISASLSARARVTKTTAAA